jgi:hypothetical protein
MASSQEILRQLVRYLSEEIDLPFFRDWSVGLSLDQSDVLSEDAKKLLADLEGCYAEFSDALVSEEFLRERYWVIAQDVSNVRSMATSPAMAIVILDPLLEDSADAQPSGGAGSSHSSPFTSVSTSASISILQEVLSPA